MKKIISLMLVCLFAISAFGCGKEKALESNVAVSVNGVNITDTDVEKMINYVAVSNGVEVNDDNRENITSYAINTLVNMQIITQGAKEKGVELTDEEVEKSFNDNIVQYYGSEDEFKTKYLDVLNITKEDALNNYKVSMLYDEATKKIISELDVDAQAIYDKDPSKYYSKAQVSASHILVATEDEAKDIIAKLNDGANFSDLATQYSTDPSVATNEGNLGYFNSDGYVVNNGEVSTTSKMVDEFTQAAFDMKVGTFSSTPVKTQYGYHVLYVDDRIEAHQQSFDEVKDLIINNAQSEAINAWLDDVQDRAEIIYADDKYDMNKQVSKDEEESK